MTMDDHTALWQVLLAAHQQAMNGKGKDRHGGGLPFEQQPIMAIARMLDGSIDGHLYQIMKKAQEAGRMAKRGDQDAAVRELHGAIVYAAAAVMVLEAPTKASLSPSIAEEAMCLDRHLWALSQSEINLVRERREEVAVELMAHGIPLNAVVPSQLRWVLSRMAGSTQEDARTAIDRALEELGCQEHEIDHNILRATMRKQREKIAEEAIDRAGEKHVARGNKHGGSDNG
jgi:hypothetical protein